MRSLISHLVLLASLFLWMPHAYAQSAISICDDPKYRNSQYYEKYCSSSSGAPSYEPPAPVYDPTRSFFAMPSVTGEFYVLKQNGRRLSASDLRTVPLEFGDKLITGPTGSARLVLPDQTLYSLGPYSEIVVDEFLFDPKSGDFTEMTLAITKGLLRFISAQVRPHPPRTVKTPVGDLGIRGTDVEVRVDPDGSGYVKLFSGTVDLREYDTGTMHILQPGQMITYRDFSQVTGPTPIQ
ncbi:MAG TPA: FecR family protein [Stellaceae bacterium]|nr:FecR family protein [Stellaceae bacterium]